MLKEKGIKTSAEELEALAHQWNSIQQLKGDLGNTSLKDYDIGVTHNLGGVYNE